MPLEPGDRLGPYEIVAPLGSGGMGVVYLGKDTRLGREVAIKVLHDSVGPDPTLKARFEAEGRMVSKLQHPNICTLHDIGSVGGVDFLVMEHLIGPTLRQRLARGSLPLPDALRVGREIALAIEAAHRQGVIHRDLKPGNVILTESGAKVLDFGLAKRGAGMPTAGDRDEVSTEARTEIATEAPTLSGPLTRHGAVVGTLPYMAPEQVEGRPADVRSDIWALGCVLYEVVAGKRPFAADSDAGLISAILTARPQSLLDREPLAPERLDRLVGRCLAKDPDERWQSARDVALELASLTSAPASGVALPSDPGRERRPRTRRLAAALVLSAGLALGAGWWALWPRPEPAVVAPGTAVAVLPFENLTGDGQLGYLGSGLAAGVISGLSEIPTVNVVSRARTWSTLEKRRSAARTAEELGANALVEGEVHAAGGRLRVDASVRDPAAAAVLWAKSFEGTTDEVFELQNRIVRALAPVLSVRLSDHERRRLARGGPTAKAFDYYLQGLERLDQRDNPRHLDFAIDLFRQAIRIDPDVAVFHAGLSNALWHRHLMAPDRDESEEATRVARRALELDPELPEGHVALARALRLSGRYAESIAELRPLLARHPKPDEAFRELAAGYRLAGDLEASGECLESAVALGPENWFNWNSLGVHQTIQGRVDAARVSFEKAAQLAPVSVHWPRLNLGALKIVTQDFAGAIEDFEATGASTSDPDLASNMGTAYYFQERFGEAADLYRRAVALEPGNHTLRRNLGDALEALGRRDDAAGEYRRAFELADKGLDELPHDNELLRSRALYAAKSGDCPAALDHSREAGALLPKDWQNQLPLAMAFALCGDTETALVAVRHCVESGVPGSFLRRQDELASLAAHPTFLELTR